MIAFILIFLLSVAGTIETVYLIRKRMAMNHPICPMGGNCEKVLSSRYNRLLGIPNDVLGLVNYIAVAVLSLSLYLGILTFMPLTLLLKILVAASSLMSLVLIYMQWRMIKAWCFWCLVSALTVFSMAAILIFAKI
jgi:uncharacterized membrane protein